MAVPVQQLFPDEDPYGVRGAAAFAQVEAQDGACFMASTDESTAFSFVEVPPEWWVYQAGPAVRADALDPAWVGG
eukprot:3572495-Alexandrium_andersonii.AAC.1